MGRYFFDVTDGVFSPDIDGRDLPGGRGQIDRELRRALSELILTGDLPTSALVAVRNESRQTVVRASVSVSIDYADIEH